MVEAVERRLLVESGRSFSCCFVYFESAMASGRPYALNFKRLGLALGGVVGAAAIGIALENDLGIAFDTSYRIARAILCLSFVLKLRTDYPTDKWPNVSLISASVVNILLFFYASCFARRLAR